MNSFEYCSEIAKISLKAAMKSEISNESVTSEMSLLNLQNDIEFLKEVKDRCTELTVKLSKRNITLFKNKSKKFIISYNIIQLTIYLDAIDKSSNQLDNIKIISTNHYNYIYEYTNIIEENLDFARRTCLNSIDLFVNSHNIITDYESRIKAIGIDCQNIMSIEELADSILTIKEGLFDDLREELQLEKEEDEAMIKAEITASVTFKREKALKLKAEKLNAKAKIESLSIEAQTSKLAIIQAPLAKPEVSDDLAIEKIFLSDKLADNSVSDKLENYKPLKRNPTGTSN